jgi:bcr-type benzoyl-CoA reductase subunit C
MDATSSRGDDALTRLRAAADDPYVYAREWKRRTGGRVIGSFPMNFPSELIHATGGLPVIVQETRTPITAGRGLLPEFYCSYTRSVADQAAVGELEVFDAFVVTDHCVQLLGAVDVIRWALPEVPNHFAQFISSIDDPWSEGQVQGRVAALRGELEEIVGAPIRPESVARSIGLFNENRSLLREFFDGRRSGRLQMPAADLQALVTSSMVMDVAEHSALLRIVLDAADRAGRVDAPPRVHLSGHFCARVPTALLETIEDCGVVVVDDDIYHGWRYIATDVPEAGDPFDALAEWYLARNIAVPCATRIHREVDWDGYLVDRLATSGAEAAIVLMAKFCEPLMLYYPELRKTLEDRGVPVLLIETEHDGLPEESIRTRVETFAERIRRNRTRAHAPA